MKRRSLASSDETPQPRTLRRNAAAPSDETPQQHHRPSISAEERTVGRKANITPVSDLRPGRIDYTIHEFRGPNEENDLRHLDLILIDQKGDPIYAEIPPDAVLDLKSFLEEGKIIIMSKITVERAKPGYRAVENPYMIKLNTRTCIFPCAETINFPKYTFSLTPFEILPQYIRRTDRFLDVIGKITGVSNAAKVYNTSGDPMMRRVIRLQDLMGNVIELSLSGKGATEFPAEAVLDVAYRTKLQRLKTYIYKAMMKCNKTLNKRIYFSSKKWTLSSIRIWDESQSSTKRNLEETDNDNQDPDKAK
ncbi:hypothetical protein U9M48_016442 [Paspalum notatum var. saurae]|uniref:Replication protein A 70 kDa DNA-binding subunit B/D first OB fold domain-containing protein n=1 Tax=Paspalum notatum var. saurae TaxID=547442 RepID=A0AAQ3T7D1_PASNO